MADKQDTSNLAEQNNQTYNICSCNCYYDIENNMISLRARYYDPNTGQFISRDPLVAQTRDPYGYANGNPISFTDPTGLICLYGQNPGDNGRCPGVVGLYSTTKTVNTISGRFAYATGALAVVCWICAPIAGPVAGVSGAIALGTGLTKTVIDCKPRGSGRDECISSLASTGLDSLGFGTGHLVRPARTGSRHATDLTNTFFSGLGTTTTLEECP